MFIGLFGNAFGGFRMTIETGTLLCKTPVGWAAKRPSVGQPNARRLGSQTPVGWAATGGCPYRDGADVTQIIEIRVLCDRMM